MKSFKEYLQETIQTRRQGIIHFYDMKPVEFINWAKNLKTEFKGILKNIKVNSKLDGLGARFGKDVSGRIFFEGSRTGPQFEPKAFSNYARGKGSSADVIERSCHYDDMLEIFQKAPFMKSIPNNTKIICEIFYNPMAELTDSGIRFVTITYDKKKMGKLMTIAPYNALLADSGDPHPDEAEIIKNLINESSDDIKIISPSLKMGEIDLSAMIDPITIFDQESIEILQSRKAIHREIKQSLINIIQAAKDQIADYILNHPGIEGKFNLGPEIEGIVMWLDSGPHKITTKDFQQAHAAQKRT